MAGIVHFSNFFRMMEAAEHDFLRCLGFSVHQKTEGGVVGWPRVKAHCEYLRPLRFEEEVEIEVGVAELRTRSLRYRFVFRRKGEAETVAMGEMVAVCVKVDPVGGGLNPMPIPGVMRAALETFLGQE